MASELMNSISVSASGMRVQGTRIRVISENVANADTLSSTPGGDPYARQQISFTNELDKGLGVKLVQVDAIEKDMSKPFATEYRPDHPGADENGYVKMPNVNRLIEVTDMREAQRTYEANVGMVEQARTMINRTIDLLKN